jgi:hypothetical protein
MGGTVPVPHPRKDAAVKVSGRARPCGPAVPRIGLPTLCCGPPSMGRCGAPFVLLLLVSCCTAVVRCSTSSSAVDSGAHLDQRSGSHSAGQRELQSAPCAALPGCFTTFPHSIAATGGYSLLLLANVCVALCCCHVCRRHCTSVMRCGLLSCERVQRTCRVFPRTASCCRCGCDLESFT